VIIATNLEKHGNTRIRLHFMLDSPCRGLILVYTFRGIIYRPHNVNFVNLSVPRTRHTRTL